MASGDAEAKPEYRCVPRVKLWEGFIVLECACGTAIPYPGHPDEIVQTECGKCGRLYECVAPGDVPASGVQRVIDGVQDALARNRGVDIVYVHATPTGGAHAAIVRVGTPAYVAISEAYPGLVVPPHDHVEPGMW